MGGRETWVTRGKRVSSWERAGSQEEEGWVVLQVYEEWVLVSSGLLDVVSKHFFCGLRPRHL